MKRIFLFVVALCVCMSVLRAQEQNGAKKSESPAKDSITLPYQKYPTLPAFNILMMDSVTIFNTYNIPEGAGPIALVFFSPDCGHCKRTTRRIVDSMAMLKDIRFYMMTAVHNMTDIHKFYDEFRLANYDNVKLVGRDYEFFFAEYYGIKFVPDVALYDGHKKLIKLIQGETTAKELLESIHPVIGN